jgi:acylphosphatase
LKRIHLKITGHVQGVGFRYFCHEQAGRLGLTGYARNISDGTVEVEAQGGADAIEQFVQAVSDGPRQAEVTNIEREKRDIDGNEDGFGR